MLLQSRSVRLQLVHRCLRPLRSALGLHENPVEPGTRLVEREPTVDSSGSPHSCGFKRLAQSVIELIRGKDVVPTQAVLGSVG